MAEKKARAKAKQAKKKPAKSARKGAARKQPKKRAAASVSAVVEAPFTEQRSPDVPAVDANRDRELDDGALATRIATAVLAVLATQQSGHSQPGSQPTLDSIQQQLAEIVSLLRQSAHAPATPGAPAPHQPVAAALASGDSIINARRQEIWRAELNQQKPLRLPRPTVVGRAVLEAELAQDPGQGPPPARDVFRRIQANGDHHLSQTMTRRIASAGPAAASALRKQYKSRCQRLIGARVMEKAGTQYGLTRHGERIFSGWPDWGVADDDADCCGVLSTRTPQ